MPNPELESDELEAVVKYVIEEAKKKQGGGSP